MKVLIPIIIMLLIDLYVFQAIIHLATSFSRLEKIVLYSVYWTLPVFAIFVLLATSSGATATWPKALFTIARAVLVISYFSKMIAVFPILIDDVRRAGVWTVGQFSKDVAYDASRSNFMSKFAILLSGLPFGLLSYGIFRNPYRYKVHKHIIEIEKLHPDLEGFKIIQISDIHSGSFFLKEPVKNSIDIINKSKADLVLFTGDLVNNKTEEMDEYYDVFDKINSKHGVYSVLGNHDYGDYFQWPTVAAKKANFQAMLQAHKTLGWDLLMNENRIIEVGEAKLGVIGVENYSALKRFPRHGNLKKAYEGSEAADLKILLSHDPTHWDLQVKEKYEDIAIMFAGHTHGAQFGIEIPGVVKWSPCQYVYKQWAGLYQEGKQFLYVNRGLGFLGYPGRIGILPEITEIVLKTKSIS